MEKTLYSELPEEIRKEMENVFTEIRSKYYDAAISTRSMYIRNLVFMNGGALIAILSARATLIANDVIDVGWTYWPLVFFFVGLILAVLLNGMLYLYFEDFAEKLFDLRGSSLLAGLTIKEFLKKSSEIGKQDDKWKMVNVLIGIASLIFFIVGAISSIRHLT